MLTFLISSAGAFCMSPVSFLKMSLNNVPRSIPCFLVFLFHLESDGDEETGCFFMT